jgi:hypothetical protein
MTTDTQVAETPKTIGSVFYGEPKEPEQPTEQVTDVEQVSAEPVKDENQSEPGAEATPEVQQEGEDELFYELDGKQYSVQEMTEFKNRGLMQADYTKKTTELAEDRKTFKAEQETERAALAQERQSLQDMKAQLEVLVKEDEEVDWAELKEDDPERYIELKERSDKRQKMLDELKGQAKAESQPSQADLETEVGLLQARIPSWFDEKGNETEQRGEDLKLIQSFATKQGFTGQELSSLVTAKHWVTLYYAAKHEESLQKAEELKLKREGTPKIIKPGSKKQPHGGQEKTLGQVLYG